ncbi:MAG: hypothetical protein IPP83_01185 [Flavobacteriales bacterium]|nr:hypothetical protein [Flavobacteriales bacterium]
MLTPLISLPELVADARKDHKALWSTVNRLLPRLRRVQGRDGAETIPHMEPWTSPRGNNWLLHFSTRSTGPAMHPLVWCSDGNGSIIALLITPTGTTYHLEGGMIQHYGAHVEGTADLLEALQSFFFENHYYTTETLHEFSPGIWDVRVTMDQGLGLGEWDRTTDIIHVRSYVSYVQLFPEQREHLVALDARRAWDELAIGQQAERLDRALRKNETKLRVA